MADKPSGYWLNEAIRLSGELKSFVEWAEDPGLTQIQKEQRLKAVEAVFKAAQDAMHNFMEAAVRELGKRKT